MQQVQYFQETLDEFVVVFREGGVLFSGHTAGADCSMLWGKVVLSTCVVSYL